MRKCVRHVPEGQPMLSPVQTGEGEKVGLACLFQLSERKAKARREPPRAPVIELPVSRRPMGKGALGALSGPQPITRIRIKCKFTIVSAACIRCDFCMSWRHLRRQPGSPVFAQTPPMPRYAPVTLLLRSCSEKKLFSRNSQAGVSLISNSFRENAWRRAIFRDVGWGNMS